MTTRFNPGKRLVIKIGSSLLLQEDSRLRTRWLASVAADIAALHQNGVEVLIVSSGSVGLGKSLLDGNIKQPNRKQAAAACGQPLLMQTWQQAFAPHQLASAQVLMTLADTEERKRYLNLHRTIRTLLGQRIIPIFNENDSVTTEGVLYGDNDRLAARIAAMCEADNLLILSDVDGLYNRNPQLHADAQLMEQVETITPEIEAMAGGTESRFGTGGMATKLAAAKIATAAGCHCIIANGQAEHPISTLQRSTHFQASTHKHSGKRRWISGALQPCGRVWIDEGAEAALRKGSSLLHVGITQFEGDFAQGDTLEIVNAEGKRIGKGLATIDADTAQQLRGRRSESIASLLGYEAAAELIHRDYMVLL